MFPFLAIAGLAVERGLAALVWKGIERHLVRRIRILLVGDGELLEMYLSKIESRRPYPLEWVGRLGEDHCSERLASLRYFGHEDRLHAVLESERIEMVVVAYPTQQAARYEPILTALSNELVAVKVLPDFGRYSTFTYSAEHECGIPLLAFNQVPAGSTDRALKRLFDVAIASAVLVLASPLYFLIGLLVKLTSKGPMIYSQKRVGADGRVFDVYKFRSMPIDAEAKTGAVWAKAEDDRATPLGKWLRRSSLDELPQFYNVLRGDMSLVGPRSERPVFVQQFRQEIPKYMLRHKMKSGITGWAQVNGWRGNTSLEERVKHDLYYIGHWSHFLDFKILLMTPFVVFKDCIQRHAY
jgi:Undecaprenyl-phosphate glucose phosphotransferase